MKLLAKTFFGLEAVLADELEQLGAKEVVQHKRAVSFAGDQALMYRANLHLRTALRILQPIHAFVARNEQALYRGVQQVNWARYLHPKGTLAVDSVVNSPYFKHSHYAALKTKDAIVDQFRKKFGKRPSVEVANPTLRINLHISQDRCSLSLDSSGDSLHKRGYRLDKNPAPLNEVLAAGMLRLAGWQADRHFVDPMCGSGTLPIEAAMMAYGVAPGLYRQFGFMKWPDFDRQLWDQLLRQAGQEVQPYFAHEIWGTDQSERFIQIATDNTRRARLRRAIKLEVCSMQELQPPEAPGLVMINPPYGERLKADDLTALYSMIGDQLKQRFAGYDAWVLSANKEAMKRIGLRASVKKELFNGPLACRFHKFEMYRGKGK